MDTLQTHVGRDHSSVKNVMGSFVGRREGCLEGNTASTKQSALVLDSMCIIVSSEIGFFFMCIVIMFINSLFNMHPYTIQSNLSEILLSFSLCNITGITTIYHTTVRTIFLDFLCFSVG